MRQDPRAAAVSTELPSNDEIRSAACGVAAFYPQIAAIYLFGSYARGGARPGSDVDLAVLLERGAVCEDRIEFEAGLARSLADLLGIPVDVLLLRPDLPPALLFDVFAVETVLFARDCERAHGFARRCRSEYRDLLPRRERAFERLMQRIRDRADALNRS